MGGNVTLTLMPEAVIASATRTPIGRARKGSLVDARPDDLVAFAIRRGAGAGAGASTAARSST